MKKMLSTVLKDKEKIEETIEELDRYKRDTTLEKVMGKIHVSFWLSCVLTCRLRRDFGVIFAELLPGNFAKLRLPKDKISCGGWRSKRNSAAFGNRV
jgi:structural maintenance of chromosome 2